MLEKHQKNAGIWAIFSLRTRVIGPVFRASEAFCHKTYVESKSAIHSTNAWYTATYLVAPLNTNVGNLTDAKRFSGIAGCRTPGISTFLYMHGPSLSGHWYPPRPRHRRRTPTIHRGSAQRTSSAGRWEEIEQVAGRDVGNAGQNPGPRAAERPAMAAVGTRALLAAGIPEIATESLLVLLILNIFLI